MACWAGTGSYVVNPDLCSTYVRNILNLSVQIYLITGILSQNQKEGIRIGIL
jgi:hypothetical protein